jgi:hypothetical protein
MVCPLLINIKKARCIQLYLLLKNPQFTYEFDLFGVGKHVYIGQI